MDFPSNGFKSALNSGKCQFGLWAALADPYVTELLATVGFDWLLIDNEHAPNDLRSTLAQLQAVKSYKSHPVVRPVKSDAALIKQFLDIGAQTLLLPMIDTPEDAKMAVSATRYPPEGVRGVGSALARASKWNGIGDYLVTASRELCVLVQVESTLGLSNLEAIAAVEGVDGVFFGPADLSASMGLLGQPGSPVVREAIRIGIGKVRNAGKASGVLATDLSIAEEYINAGATFIAVGTDTGLLRGAASSLVSHFLGASSGTSTRETGAY